MFPALISADFFASSFPEKMEPDKNYFSNTFLLASKFIKSIFTALS